MAQVQARAPDLAVRSYNRLSRLPYLTLFLVHTAVQPLLVFLTSAQLQVSVFLPCVIVLLIKENLFRSESIAFSDVACYGFIQPFEG